MLDEISHQSTAPAANAIESNTSCHKRLPYGAPTVFVRLGSGDWHGLRRLCKLTGQFPPEAAAMLIEPQLLAKPTAAKFREIAALLRDLYLARRRSLGTTAVTSVDQVPTRVAPDHIRATRASAMRVPLSRAMNQTLYRLAEESGLTRSELARELLRVAIHSSRAMSQEMEAEASRVKDQCTRAPGLETGAGTGKEVIP